MSVDRRILPEAGILQARDEPFALALGSLAIDEQAEPLLEGEPFDVALVSLLVERLGHAGEPERNETVASGMCEHACHLLLIRPQSTHRVAAACGRAHGRESKDQW